MMFAMKAPSPKQTIRESGDGGRSILRIAGRILARAERSPQDETPLRARVTAIVGLVGGIAVFFAVLATTEASAIGVRNALEASAGVVRIETLRAPEGPCLRIEHHGGTGLGLSIVHGIVQEHGASIDVDSEHGRGTRFCVRFPLEAPPAVN